MFSYMRFTVHLPRAGSSMKMVRLKPLGAAR